jgi:hypothetical protein
MSVNSKSPAAKKNRAGMAVLKLVFRFTGQTAHTGPIAAQSGRGVWIEFAFNPKARSTHGVRHGEEDGQVLTFLCSPLFISTSQKR